MKALTQQATEAWQKRHTVHPQLIRMSDVKSGDHVLVRTNDAFYGLCVLGSGLYRMKGGRPDRLMNRPSEISLSTCSWEGHPVDQDILVAKGYCLVLGNKDVTAPIEKVWLVPCNRASKTNSDQP